MNPVDAPDTEASLEHTADYFNRKANPDDPECICTGIPRGQHIPPCPKCTTPDAHRCTNCGNRQAHRFEVCEACGQPKES